MPHFDKQCRSRSVGTSQLIWVLHCLSLSMWIYINLDHIICLAENSKWAIGMAFKVTKFVARCILAFILKDVFVQKPHNWAIQFFICTETVWYLRCQRLKMYKPNTSILGKLVSSSKYLANKRKIFLIITLLISMKRWNTFMLCWNQPSRYSICHKYLNTLPYLS